MAARSHAIVHSSILESDLADRSIGAQLLYRQLLERPERNKVGLIMYRPRSWARSLPCLNADDVEALVEELEEHDFLVVDRDTLEVVHRTHMHHDGVLKMSQVLIAAAKERPAVESPKIGAAIDDQIPPSLRDRWPTTIARSKREVVKEWIDECDAGSYKPPRKPSVSPTEPQPTSPTEAFDKGSDNPNGSLPEGCPPAQRQAQGRGMGTGRGEGPRTPSASKDAPTTSPLTVVRGHGSRR